MGKIFRQLVLPRQSSDKLCKIVEKYIESYSVQCKPTYFTGPEILTIF